MKKNVVIADDFENTRWVIEFTIKNNFDINILKAENGKEALQYFDGRPIHLLITDLNMPEMSGIELIEQVKQLSAYQFLPIILLTTETDPTKRNEASALKITAWIKKPFKQDEFLKVVKKCLG